MEDVQADLMVNDLIGVSTRVNKEIKMDLLHKGDFLAFDFLLSKAVICLMYSNVITWYIKCIWHGLLLFIVSIY